MLPLCSLHVAASMRTKQQHKGLEQIMENIISSKRIKRAAEARRMETKESIKDAIGAFLIIVMLYVGLFIPSL